MKNEDWIPCRNIIPKRDGNYLVTVESENGDKGVVIKSFCDGLWYPTALNSIVTAWMPCPRPWENPDNPKEGDMGVFRNGKWQKLLKGLNNG